MRRTSGSSQDGDFKITETDRILDRVDDWREKQDDYPSRAEAIRRLVEIGLKASSHQARSRAQGPTPLDT